MSLFKKQAQKPARVEEETGERAQLTVLFYDIVGSTSLAESRDAEGLRARLEAIHATARDIVTAHGGSLEQVLGDGGMAYFGYPVVSEDAAFQAVNAALDLLAARAGIDRAPDIRIGIATSFVVLPNRAEATAGGRLGAVGVAPNLAARLEAAAPVNGALVAQATYAQTWRATEFEVVEGLSLKGFPDVTRAWRPLALKSTETLFERDRDTGSALAGRAQETERLQAAWRAARAGRGAAILIEGEAGAGKSRLIAEMAGRIEAARVVALQCQPRTRDEALAPIIRMYDRAYEAQADAELAQAAVDTAQALARIEEDESLGTEARRDAIVACVADGLDGLAAGQPMLLIAEDLHWADEVTLAVLERMAGRVAGRAMLMLGTSRQTPNGQQPAPGIERLDLGPLQASEARALVGAVAHAPLTAPTVGRIVAKADGNPLFLIELAAHVSEIVIAGGAPDDLRGAEVGTLRDLLAARLDGAGKSKRTAQIASVLGREYSYYVMSRLAEFDRELLDADLAQLVDHLLVDPLDDGEAYSFRHALIRDVAYDSQLQSVRRKLHARVVELIDEDPAIATAVPAIVLADHCMNAALHQRGLTLLTDVAEEAIRRSAREAPRKMLERVLAAGDKVPEARARDRIALRAISLLGPLVTLADGHSAAKPLYERGQELYFALDEAERAPFFPVLWGWWFTSGDLVEQTRRSEVLIRDVNPQSDAESRLQALHCGWATLFDGGAHDRCLAAISDGLDLFDAEVAKRSRYLYGHDARVCGLGERALCGWLKGQLELSARSIADCEAWADETAHLASQLHALDIATQVAVFNQDTREIERILSRIEALSGDDDMPVIAAKRDIFRAWMRARNGDVSQAGAAEDGLARLRGFGVLEDTPFYVDIAAQIAAASGDASAALGPLEAEIAQCRATGLTYWLPELLRRKARILGGGGAAEALDEAFELAQAQNAQMLALRGVATRLDLGLDLPPEVAAEMAAHLEAVSDCALKRRVGDALAR